jgi:hypothetical protein
LTAANLRDYFAGKPVGNLAEGEQREHCWQAFLAALDKGKGGDGDA